jgi:hypothetical protein
MSDEDKCAVRSAQATVVAVPLADVASEALVAELRRRGGFRIVEDDGKGWVSLQKASLAAGFHRNWLCKILRRGAKPPGLELDCARTGRARAVRVAPEFRNWAAARREPQPSLL